MPSSSDISVWDRLRQFADSQRGPFTSQEVISWFRRHAPNQATDGTIRAHTRGASWNVDNRSQFASREPFLTRLGHGTFRRATAEELEAWRVGASIGTTLVLPEAAHSSSGRDETLQSDEAGEWHTEENVQSLLVSALATEGWRILSVANTATKEHGIDVIASRGGQTVGIEVKGYPSKRYADPARAAEKKRTQPSTQAGHWYAQAVLAAMRLRSKEPNWRSVIALPDFPRYRGLYAETLGSLSAAAIEVWWIDQTGRVTAPDW